MTKHTLISWTAVILWMSIIFYLSHQPGSQSSELSLNFAEPLIEAVEKVSPEASVYIEDFHTYVRKSAHFIAYLIMGILSVNALKASGVQGFRKISMAFAICLLFAASDEFHQLFIDGRSGEARDVLIDSAGALVGIGIYSLSRKWLPRSKRKPYHFA